MNAVLGDNVITHDFAVDIDRPELLPDGVYSLVLVDSWKGLMYGRVPKLMLTFRIIDEGQYYGKQLIRCYNLKGFTKRKEIKPSGWHSNLVKEYSILFGRPNNLKQIGVRAFKSKVIKGRTRAVTKDAKQNPLHPNLHYSVIDALLSVEAGDGYSGA